MKLRALDRKLVRDMLGMRGQVIAIALVMIGGVTTYVSMTSVSDTLHRTLELYYREYRFADGFASVRRAPEALLDRLRDVDGIGVVETRVTAAVSLEIREFDEPVTGLIVSLPEGRQPLLNRLYIRRGRLVEAGRENEVVLNETFAEAHGLQPGDALAATINGRRRMLSVVGIALSPSYLMQMQPGTMFPDPERFGVLWMGRAALGAAYDMAGAFNDVAFTLAPGASLDDVLQRVDLVLYPYGGVGAYGRDEHPSHALITEEFRQLAGMATMLPAIFLAVAAFLLNIVVTRLIALQREQIAVLKAFGYSDVQVGLHYLKLVLVIALIGGVIGTALGAWAGRGMGTMYLQFYRFPWLHHTLRGAVVVTAIALTAGASLLGVLRAVRRAVKLPPAEAMRPAPPANYRRTLVERLGLERLLDQPTRMILRQLERQPLKALLTLIGIGSSCAILVMGLFWGDAVDEAIRVQFGLSQRDDLTVTFSEPAASAAVYELRALPGVLHAEPFRSIPVRLRNGHLVRDAGLEGIPQDAYLRRIIGTSLESIEVPHEGIVLTQRLAELLDARVGDEIAVQVMEGRRRTRTATVAAVAEQYLGFGAYMELEAANRLAGSGQVVSGAFLLVDPKHDAALTQALRDRPRVAGVVSQDRAIRAFMDTSAQSMLVFTFILSLFAGVIAFGVVYNSMRISLSERDRELASMRVLGFRRAEIARILLGEMAVLVLLAIPLGFALGAVLSTWSATALESDMFRFPVVLSRRTFGMAAVVVLTAAVVSAVLVRRQLNRLDLIGVLKTRE